MNAKTASEHIQQLKDGGNRIIGCFPLYPPLELLYSFGLVPVVLWGLNDSVNGTHESDKHLQNYCCSVSRRLAQFVISDGGRLLDGLFMYNACDTFRNMPELLTCGLQEAGHDLPLFKIHVPMAPHEQTDSDDYIRKEIASLTGELEKAFDIPFDEACFREGVELYREIRSLWQQVESRVATGYISFTDYAEASRNCYFLPVEEQVRLIQSLLADDTSNSGDSSGDEERIGVFLTGILPPARSICEAIVDAGLRVVGNDIASMTRAHAFTAATTGNPEEYYLDFYKNHFPCTTLLHSQDRRIDTVMRIVKESGAAGVIYLGEKFCEYENFEIPHLTKRLKQEGFNTLSLEFSIDDDEHIGPFKTRIEAFAELIGG